LLPELSELFSNFSTGFPTVAKLPSIAGLRPFFDNNLLRMEDETSEGLYQVRAELPGVDPIEDVEVTVRDGQLTIKAERTQANDTNGRSEFPYGSFSRTIVLPVSADEDEINATYDRGILTIFVPLSDDASTEKHVEVIETMLVDEDEDDDENDEQEESAPAEIGQGEDQEQPAS
jgi:HSP20 family molecular chaperone IbpA